MDNKNRFFYYYDKDIKKMVVEYCDKKYETESLICKTSCKSVKNGNGYNMTGICNGLFIKHGTLTILS